MTQAFFDRVGDQARVGADLFPHVAMFEQQPQGIRRGVGGRLVRGDDAGHHHRVQVGVGDDVRLFLLNADAERHPAVPAGILPHLVENGARELPELPDGIGDGDLLLGSRTSPRVDGVCDRVLAQGVHVLLGHTEEVQGDGERNLPEHLVDEVDVTGIDETIDVFAGQSAHHRLVVGERGGSEGLHQRSPSRHVCRFVLVDESAVHGIAVSGQNSVRLVGGRGDLLESDRRREEFVVAEDGFDVFVARDHPVPEFRAVEDGLFVTRPTQRCGGVHLVRPGEGIERCGARGDGAAGRGGEGGVVDGAAALRGGLRGVEDGADRLTRHDALHLRTANLLLSNICVR